MELFWATEIKEQLAIKHLEINMKIEKFIKELSTLKFENTFNPYSDSCEIHDCDNSPKKRREILIQILEKANKVSVDSVWIGRDLGYRGGRRTGLALTDDIHFSEYLKRWDIEFTRPTKGEPVPERTATVIWSILDQINEPIFLWNVFPLHPYQKGNPFSNRAHNAKEKEAGKEFLSLLIEYLKPKKVIAIGNDAAEAIKSILKQEEIIKVRHPSYGGQNQFLSQIRSLYQLSTP